MLMKYCVKINFSEGSTTVRSKAHTKAEAIINVLKERKHLNITKIELLGDALPAPQVSVAKLVKEEKIKQANKTKRWQAALKYQKKAGFSPLTVKTAK